MNIIGGIYNWMEARRRRRQMETAVVFGVGCAAFLICGIIFVIVSSIFNAVETGNVRSLYGETYAEACQGMPAGNADEANLPDVEAPRAVLLLIGGTQRRHQWHSELPSQWQAEKESEVGLIGCVQEETIVLETCEYERDAADGEGTFTIKIERQQNQATIALINPDTGRIIDSLTRTGSDPDECPDDDDVSVSGSQEGGEVEWSEFAPWIETYVFDE